jgi:hypothetical protein
MANPNSRQEYINSTVTQIEGWGTNMDKQLDEKEKTNILLSEYNSLRTEINERISNAFQVGAIGLTGLALCFQIQMSDSTRVNALLIIGIGAGCLLWIIFHNFLNAGLRVQELERDINKRASEKLLIWENERGGLAIKRWQLRILVSLLNLNEPR